MKIASLILLLQSKAPVMGTGCIAHFKKVYPSVISLLNDSSVGTLSIQTTKPTYNIEPMKMSIEIWAIQPVSSRGAFNDPS